MYSEGIFDCSKPQVHHLKDLPNEVFLLDDLNDVEKFLSSKKDLALGTLSYPRGYDCAVEQGVKSDIDLDFKVKDIDSVAEQSSQLATALLQPILPLCYAIEARTPSKKRLTIKVIRDQMCPLFHVDRVFIRILITLAGPGTQWLQERDINRKNLGKGYRKPIAKPDSYLQQILVKQVGILKGSKYPGSKGLVHRSPPVNPTSDPRLIMRLDFI